MAMHTGKPSDCWFDALAVRSTLDFFTVAAGDCDDFGRQPTRAHTRTSSPVLGPGLQPQRTVVHMGKPSKYRFDAVFCLDSAQSGRFTRLGLVQTQCGCSLRWMPLQPKARTSAVDARHLACLLIVHDFGEPSLCHSPVVNFVCSSRHNLTDKIPVFVVLVFDVTGI